MFFRSNGPRNNVGRPVAGAFAVGVQTQLVGMYWQQANLDGSTGRNLWTIWAAFFGDRITPGAPVSNNVAE